jgi:RNA polymerase primary sigma factor
MHRVGSHRLTAADEVRLSRRIERGDLEAKAEMIEANMPLVRAVAKAYRGVGVPYDDLVQEGAVGLVRAVEKFDHRRGLKFSTYAVWWIRRALSDAVAEARTIRIPTQAARSLAAVQRAEADLRRGAGVAPTNEAIAARTGLTAARVRVLRRAARVTASLDDRVGEDGAALADLVADPDPVDPWRRVDERETRTTVRTMVSVLPRRHREVLVRRYGLVGDREQTHAEIAAALHVGEERSRQLEREALHRLREMGGGRVARAA